MYLIFKKEYKEFIIIGINLNTARKDDEKHLYNKDDLYFELNNAGYNNIT